MFIKSDIVESLSFRKHSLQVQKRYETNIVSAIAFNLVFQNFISFLLLPFKPSFVLFMSAKNNPAKHKQL